MKAEITDIQVPTLYLELNDKNHTFQKVFKVKYGPRTVVVQLVLTENQLEVVEEIHRRTLDY